MAKLEKNKRYKIGKISNENYDDCVFKFGTYKIIDIDDEQCFRTIFPGHAELDRIWWDSEGFKIIELS